MQLVQSLGIDAEEFRALVRHVLDHLETLALQDRVRWKELLSYVNAMAYHKREKSEYPSLLEAIKQSIRDEDRRKEIIDMPQSMADAHLEQGRNEGGIKMLQSTLLRLLLQRFTKVPAAVEKVIRATKQVEQLNIWFDRGLTAPTLKDVGIAVKR